MLKNHLGWSRLTGEVRRFRSLLHQIVKTGLKKFNVSSPIELQDYLTYVADRMDSAGTHYFIFRKRT